MRRGLSTGKPTKEESAYIVACKDGFCVACMIRSEQPDCPSGFELHPGGDFHHLLSGGIRRGHMFGICLCAHHHRNIPNWGWSDKEMEEYYGPSLAAGSKRFHAAFGSDDELLDRQRRYLEGS